MPHEFLSTSDRRNCKYKDPEAEMSLISFGKAKCGTGGE